MATHAVTKARDERTGFPLAAGRWTLLLGALYVFGCSSSQVAPDYAGEPLAVLQGALSADTALGALPVDRMTVGLVWLVSSDGQRSPLVAETAHTEGEFPFGFRLTVFSPPAPEAQSINNWCGGYCLDTEPSPVYLGFVAALDDRADLARVSTVDILGASLGYGVFYFERDANPEDPLDEVGMNAARYNVPPVRGYHLFAIQKDQELYTALRRCEADGLCVEFKVPGGAAAQYDQDRRFEACLTLVPDATTCTSYPEVCGPDAVDESDCVTYFEDLGVEPTPAELAEHERCDALLNEHLPPEECGELHPWQFPGNPLGFDAKISIQLGAGLSEWLN